MTIIPVIHIGKISWNILLSTGIQQTFWEQTHVLNTNYWDPKSLFSTYQLISTTFITHQKATYMYQVLSWSPNFATRLRMFSRKVIHKNRSFYNTHHSPISKGTYMHLFKKMFIKNSGEWNNWELSNVKPSQTPWVNSMTFVNKGSKIGMLQIAEIWTTLYSGTLTLKTIEDLIENMSGQITSQN